MNKPVFISIVFVALVFLGLLYSFFRVTPKDAGDYADFLSHNSKVKDSIKSRQEKKGITKEFWHEKGQEKYASRLTSESSSVIYSKEGERSELVENFKNVHAMIQESVNRERNSQIVQTIQAEKASYHYKSGKLNLQNAEINKQQIEGTRLTDMKSGAPILMMGEASLIEFPSLTEKKVFTAVDFKGDFNEQKSRLESGRIHFSGESAYLSRGIKFTHPFGELISERAKIDLKRNVISHIFFDKPFFLKMAKGGELSASEGKIDHEKGNGELSGSVCFSDSYDGALFCSSSENVRFHYQDKDLKQLIAQNDVKISYGRASAECDEAVIDKNETTSEITLRPFNLEGTCLLRHAENDFIKAQKIFYSTALEKASLDACEGELANNKYHISFKAGSMDWDVKNDTLLLKGRPEVHEKSGFSLVSEKEILIEREKIQGKHEIKSVTCKAPCKLTQLNDSQENTLQTESDIYVNGSNKTVTIPKKEGSPLRFQDLFGEIFADEALLSYNEKGIHLIELTGNVRASHAFQGGQERSFALADKLEYNPQTREAVLIASPEKRVLLIDKVNQLEVSSPTIRMKRGEKDQKSTIQGEGDVRLHLIENEIEELKKHFKFEDKS